MESEREVARAREGVRHGVLNFAAGVSLLLCVTTVVVSSTELDEWWGQTARGGTPPGAGVRFFRTGVLVGWFGKMDPPAADWGGALSSDWRDSWMADLENRLRLGERSGWGFVFGRWADVERRSKKTVWPLKASVPVCTGVTTYGLIPYWALVGVTLFLPAVWLVGHRTALMPRKRVGTRRGRLDVLGTVVSVLLALMILAVWVRSYWVWEGISWVGPQSKTDDLSIAPPEPEVAATELRLAAWPGQFRLGYRRETTTGRLSELLDLVLGRRGLHRRTMSAEYTHHLRVEPWDPVPKRWLGFLYLRTDGRGTGAFDTTLVLGIPMWAVFGMAILPAVWAVGRGGVAGAGGEASCGECGYNLRGNTSGICPECGTLALRGTTRRASGAAN